MTPRCLLACIDGIANISEMENSADKDEPKKEQVLEGLPAAVAATRMFKRKD